MPGIRRVGIVQYGLGSVGQALVRQVLAGRKPLAGRRALQVVHVALADSESAVGDGAGLTDATLEGALLAKSRGLGLDGLPGARRRDPLQPIVPAGAPRRLVAVDVTAADGMEAVALDAVSRGWGVVLANKRPLAASLEAFRRLVASRRLRYEATVGAGLPWIEALAHLLDTGDRVLRLEASVSGTLGFLCWQLEEGVPLSAALAEARARGYTEPDPRDDLGAADVQRKALILARTLGHALDWRDLPAEPLYPPAWQSLSREQFLAELPGLDRAYAERMAAAQAVGRTLRYVVEIEGQRCSAGLQEVERGSALGRLRGATCLAAFHTERYQPAPLVISGPGAGAGVTAAAVYSDIIALGMEL